MGPIQLNLSYTFVGRICSCGRCLAWMCLFQSFRPFLRRLSNGTAAAGFSLLGLITAWLHIEKLLAENAAGPMARWAGITYAVVWRCRDRRKP